MAMDMATTQAETALMIARPFPVNPPCLACWVALTAMVMDTRIRILATLWLMEQTRSDLM
jgi:hypothetical protein